MGFSITKTNHSVDSLFKQPPNIHIPICSMYGIFTNICPKNHPNVVQYTIHGASGIMIHLYHIMVSNVEFCRVDSWRDKSATILGAKQDRQKYSLTINDKYEYVYIYIYMVYGHMITNIDTEWYTDNTKGSVHPRIKTKSSSGFRPNTGSTLIILIEHQKKCRKVFYDIYILYTWNFQGSKFSIAGHMPSLEPGTWGQTGPALGLADPSWSKLIQGARVFVIIPQGTQREK